MLRLTPLAVEMPEHVDDVVRLLAQHRERAKLVAGGTDVLPNLKHELLSPDVLVHLGRVHALRGVRVIDDALEIGAMTTLHDVAQHVLVRTHVPALAHAASLVAGPQLRRMGTLGGNLALDTRCVFFNQSALWREALGHCLKKDGDVCHVVAGGRKCVAAASNDTATMLCALDASVDVRSSSGTRTIALRDFFVPDGMHNTVLQPDDLLVSVRVPDIAAPRRRCAGYAKLRHRASIDFPLLSVAVCATLHDERIEALRVVVSALQARPHALPCEAFVGRAFDDALAHDVGAWARSKCVPMTNIADDPTWRRDMIPVMVGRACAQARGAHVA